MSPSDKTRRESSCLHLRIINFTIIVVREIEENDFLICHCFPHRCILIAEDSGELCVQYRARMLNIATLGQTSRMADQPVRFTHDPEDDLTIFCCNDTIASTAH